MREEKEPEWRMAWRGLPGERRWLWPRNSSRERGRMRAASGCGEVGGGGDGFVDVGVWFWGGVGCAGGSATGKSSPWVGGWG